MIRKILAGFVGLQFILIVPSLLIITSIGRNFFNEKQLVTRVIPKSYPVVMKLLVEGISRQPEDQNLLEGRIREVILEQEYSDIVGSFVPSIFEAIRKFGGEGAMSIEMGKIKEAFQRNVPKMVKRLKVCPLEERKSEAFRFCQPVNVPLDAQFEERFARILDREIPPRVTIGNTADPFIAESVQTILKMERVFLAITLGVAVLLLGIISLLIFSPFFRILKWLGGITILLTAMLALFIFAMMQLKESIPLAQGFTPGQTTLLAFFIDTPLETLSIFTFVSGALGVLLFGSSKVLQSR